ncbi:MAG: HAD hydrolase-like protein [Terriglobia bacterium]
MLVIFDLDGTLIDSRLDLAHSVNAALAAMGRGPLAHELIFSYVGNGAPVLMKRVMGPGTSEEEAAAALQFFLDYYREHALDFTVLYPGVREALGQLHGAGMRLAVLTNKPAGITNTIMEGLQLAPFMFRVYGGDSFAHKKPHPVGIDTLRAEAVVPAASTWMVGDSAVDIQTARNAGVSACGVSYGFQPETLREFPPDLLVDRLSEFAAFLLESRPQPE